MAFDLGKLLAEVSDSDTGREQIEYIDLDLLDEDDANFYATEKIESLAANIATVGLLDPLRIRPNPDAPGRYRVVSGHRRRKALGLLKQDDPERWGKAACIEEENSKSPALQELRLIFANKDNRKMSSADLSEQALRVENLLYQLQEEGYEFPGRMRDHVAKAVGINTTKLANLKVIRENLHSAWQPAFKQGLIGESVALALARLPNDWQWIIYSRWGNNSKKLCHDHIINAAKKFKLLENKKCDRDCRVHCWSNRARLDHIAGLGMYDQSCSGCCWTCSKLKDCQWCCTVAEPQKKHLREQAKNQKAEVKAEEQKRIQPICDYTREVYERWSQAKSRADLDTAQYLKESGAGPYNDQEYFDRYELHPEAIKAENIKLPFPVTIWPSEAKALCSAADVLGCSIDYLLGRDVPGPGVEPEILPILAWGEAFEDPVDPGEYVVLAKWSEHGKMKPHTFVWDGDKWLYSDLDAAAAGAIVCYWMPMPEE